MDTAPQVFLSYSHADEAWKERLVTQLRVLEREGRLVCWDDRRIAPGENWQREIETALATCAVALLLISANFLTTRFIIDIEVPRLLERRAKNGLRIIPVFVRPCRWQEIRWLKDIQGRPKDGKFLSGMAPHDAEAALAELVGEIAHLLPSPPATPRWQKPILSLIAAIGLGIILAYALAGRNDGSLPLPPDPQIPFSKLPAPSPPPVPHLRTKLVLYPYHGIAGVDASAAASDLEIYLQDKLRTLYAAFSRDPSADYMQALRVEKLPDRPNSPDRQIAEWRRLDALLLLDGLIVVHAGISTAKSGIYFGDLIRGAPGLPTELIHIDLPLRAEEYGSIVDTHSAATLYSLALDAKRAHLPRDYYVRIAARALDVVNSLLESRSSLSPDLIELRCDISSLLSESTGIVSNPGDC